MSTLIATSYISSSDMSATSYIASNSEIASLVGQRLINLGGRLEIEGIRRLGFMNRKEVKPYKLNVDLNSHDSLCELGQDFLNKLADNADIDSLILSYRGIYDTKKSFHIILIFKDDTSVQFTVTKNTKKK